MVALSPTEVPPPCRQVSSLSTKRGFSEVLAAIALCLERSPAERRYGDPAAESQSAAGACLTCCAPNASSQMAGPSTTRCGTPTGGWSSEVGGDRARTGRIGSRLHCVGCETRFGPSLGAAAGQRRRPSLRAKRRRGRGACGIPRTRRCRLTVPSVARGFRACEWS